MWTEKAFRIFTIYSWTIRYNFGKSLVFGPPRSGYVCIGGKKADLNRVSPPRNFGKTEKKESMSNVYIYIFKSIRKIWLVPFCLYNFTDFSEILREKTQRTQIFKIIIET